MNAANKAEWNEYPDKRTLAKAGVRQTDWVKNLLSYRAAIMARLRVVGMAKLSRTLSNTAR